jgi:predicted metal-binding membrane protein
VVTVASPSKAGVLPLFSKLLKNPSVAVFTGLVGVISLSWLYLLTGAGVGMTDLMSDTMTPAAWSPSYFLLMLLMWWVMMLAMMLPSATPMILLYATVNRRKRESGNPFVPTGIFIAGYVIAWGVFSIIATMLQWSLEEAALLSPMMESSSIWFGAALLIAAGIYQLTPLKQVCLKNCQSPVGFLMHHWRPGRQGALIMGLEHGAYCLGCCWVLMGLLFFGGVMNLLWIAGLAIFVMIEKIVINPWVNRCSGLLLILWGVGLAASGY